MGDVYSHAACTIAATAAKNGDQGLFFRRDPWLLRPRRLTATWDPETYQNDKEKLNYPPPGEYWCDHDNFWMTSVEYAPLNKRGWVFQERHLSQRIMHFAANQLFWECHQCKASENYPNSLPPWAFSLDFGSGRSDPTPLKTQVHRLRYRKRYNSIDPLDSFHSDAATNSTNLNYEELDELYNNWGQWREAYSRSAVTKDEDRLIAIQGIAQDVAQISDDQLVVGMWRNRILDDLCFRCILDIDDLSPAAPFRAQRLRAPTWSWASKNQRIVLSEASRLRYRCAHLATLISVDVATGKSGELRWANLQIKCNLVHAKGTWGTFSALETLTSKLGDQTVSCIKGLMLVRTGVYLPCDDEDVELDNMFVDKRDRCPDVYMLSIRRCPLENGEEGKEVLEEMVEVLLLAQRPVPEQSFERIGFFSMDGNGCRQLLAENEASESQIITLV